MKRFTFEHHDMVGLARRERGRWVCSVHVGVRGVVEFKCYGYKRARKLLTGMALGLAGPPPKPGPTNVTELSCKVLESCGIDPHDVQEFTYQHKVGDMPTVRARLVPRVTASGRWPARVVWAEFKPKDKAA